MSIFFSSVQNILYGSQEEVEKAIENTQSIRQLCTHIEVLKKQCEKYSHHYKRLLMNQKPLNEELEKMRKKTKEVQDKLETTLEVIQELQTVCMLVLYGQ